MRWDTTKHGHTTRIEEHNGHDLTLVCLTCDPNQTAPLVYDRVQYPKYRIAYYTAVAAANRHFEKFRYVPQGSSLEPLTRWP